MNTILTNNYSANITGGFLISEEALEFLDIIAEVLCIKSFSDFKELSIDERKKYKENLIKSLTRENTLNDILRKLD